MADLKIKVGDKEYDIPKSDAGQLRKVLEAEEKSTSGEDPTILSVEGVDASIGFYYDILNPSYPELTKKVLQKMPAYQLTALYRTKVAVEILTPPLDFVSEEAKEEVATESLSTPVSSLSPSGSAGRQKKSKS